MTHKHTIDNMSIPELEAELTRLNEEDKYPHLASSIAYILTYYYYEKGDDQQARRFYRDTLYRLGIPGGYAWCYTSVPILAGIPMPHFLHREVVRKSFPRLAE